MTQFFAVIGFLAVAFVLCLLASVPMLEGTIRRLTAHRLGLVAYHEARRRYMSGEFE